jgi:hypothetical protein
VTGVVGVVVVAAASLLSAFAVLQFDFAPVGFEPGLVWLVPPPLLLHAFWLFLLLRLLPQFCLL